MNEQKQIEEITKILDSNCEGIPDTVCQENSCSSCKARQIVGAGYRKPIEAEWIVVYEYNDYRMRKEAKIACSHCGHKPKYEGYLSDMNYCPKCGAKMKDRGV